MSSIFKMCWWYSIQVWHMTHNVYRTWFNVIHIRICISTRTHCGRSCFERHFTMVVNRTERQRKAEPSVLRSVPRKSKKLPPESKPGSRHTRWMCASFRGNQNVPKKVLFNSWWNTPVISKQLADKDDVPFVTRTGPKMVKTFNGERAEGVG
jgi:hypothetical protein